MNLSQRHPLRLLGATVVLAAAAAFAQTASAMPGGGPGPMGHHGHADGAGFGGGFGGRMGFAMQYGERVLDSVNATPEQRTQIRQILQSARSDLKSQHEAGRALRDQAQALFAQPNVDAAAAESLRQRMLAQHDQASKRMLQAMIDASRVLTPEQRKSLSERYTQRRALMERHRAERDALDGGKARR